VYNSNSVAQTSEPAHNAYLPGAELQEVILLPSKRIRPLELIEHIKIIEYFHSASDELLERMGVTKSKLVPKDVWENLLTENFGKELAERKFYYVGWEYDGVLIGHSSINNIVYGDHCNIHLHIWDEQKRERGLGSFFFKSSVNHVFEKFKLKMVICEPNADNPAPNGLLQKLGLQPVKNYLTIPGIICEEQYVNRYELTAPFEIS
jgi:RimJ/RimL family protein N-acetyltransferase